MDLFSYTVKKTMQTAVALLVLSVFVFFIARLVPGDPLVSYYGESVDRLDAAMREAAMERLGLNEPLPAQYVKWLRLAAKGQFGISLKYKQDVAHVIGQMAGNTVILGGTAFVLTFVLALALAVLCTHQQGKLLDTAICKLGVVTSCIPVFWIALALIMLFSVKLGVLPSSGAYDAGMGHDAKNRLLHMVMPVAVLILGHLWYYAYMLRNKLVEETKRDYVLLCRMKGLHKTRILTTHCLKNMMPAFVSLMAISVPHLIGGTYVVEKVFAYPGLGTLSFESTRYHDYNMLMVLCLLTGLLVMAAGLLADVVNHHLDIRLKTGRKNRRMRREVAADEL